MLHIFHDKLPPLVCVERKEPFIGDFPGSKLGTSLPGNCYQLYPFCTVIVSDFLCTTSKIGTIKNQVAKRLRGKIIAFVFSFRIIAINAFLIEVFYVDNLSDVSVLKCVLAMYVVCEGIMSSGILFTAPWRTS